MKINITSRHFRADDNIQNYIRNRIETLIKYHEEIMHVDVILSYEKDINTTNICEIILKLRDKLITAKESSEDFTKSVDLTTDKIEAQIQKYKSKNKTDKHDINKERIKTS